MVTLSNWSKNSSEMFELSSIVISGILLQLAKKDFIVVILNNEFSEGGIILPSISISPKENKY